MLKTLSATQRTAIRSIHDNGNDHGLYTRTVQVLERKALVRDGRLTKAGEKAYRQIMSSGDGPEDLKQMLSFLF